jgi:hypothetical protein
LGSAEARPKTTTVTKTTMGRWRRNDLERQGGRRRVL